MNEEQKRELLPEMCVPLAIRPDATAEVTILWEPATAAEFEAAVKAGLIEISREDYTSRLEAVENRFRECGLKCRRIKSTTAEVMVVMKERNLPNTPEGRATAFIFLDEANK